MKSDEKPFDRDIAAMKLGYGEKAGLQLYRNYQRAFSEHAARRLVEELDAEPFDTTDLATVLQRVADEDIKYLPVIVCAFADDALKTAFQNSLPKGIPGGRASMLNGMGALSSLSKRVQLAYAFDVMSPDLMLEIDRLRSVRNTISHSWDHAALGEYYSKGRVAEMLKFEVEIPQHEKFGDIAGTEFGPEIAFRIRLSWILGRLAYEAVAYHRAKAKTLNPQKVLYGNPIPKWLGKVAAECAKATRAIVMDEKR
jgi:hypothetical protein